MSMPPEPDLGYPPGLEIPNLQLQRFNSLKESRAKLTAANALFIKNYLESVAVIDRALGLQQEDREHPLREVLYKECWNILSSSPTESFELTRQERDTLRKAIHRFYILTDTGVAFSTLLKKSMYTGTGSGFAGCVSCEVHNMNGVTVCRACAQQLIDLDAIIDLMIANRLKPYDENRNHELDYLVTKVSTGADVALREGE